MYVKICGIRRQEDALLAAELGADAIGLLVGQRHNSPDFISAILLSVSRAARLKNESLEELEVDKQKIGFANVGTLIFSHKRQRNHRSI